MSESVEDNHDLLKNPKRRRFTGTSLRTLNALARQVAEQQADADIEEMLMNNTAKYESNDRLLVDVNNRDEPEIETQTYQVST